MHWSPGVRYIAAALLALAAASACGSPPAPAPAPASAPASASASAPATAPADDRERAIRALEDFLRRYSGPDAHPEHTPDAMLRLALLQADRDVVAGEALTWALREPIALLRGIPREFPSYPRMDDALYWLGHMLSDARRTAEAQPPWRALVCRDHHPYPVPVDPADPSWDAPRPLPQDRTPEAWAAWERSPTPERFADPYPESCAPLPDRTGQPTRHAAEVWLILGDHHFNLEDRGAGPFALNRAASAFRHAVRASASASALSSIHAIALYKLAWTYYRQERHQAAAQRFVELLLSLDGRSQDGTMKDLRSEACTYLGMTLVEVDFAGPAEDAPYQARPGLLDTERDPAVVERKMRVGVQRVQDPAIVPQDRPFTADVYRELGRLYRQIDQRSNAAEVEVLIHKKWPGAAGP